MGKNTSPKNLSEKVKQFLGQPLAVWCARYTYRGIVAEVGEDYMTLTNPRAVEITGRSSQEVPNTEDPIPGDLVITLQSIEILGQPAWVWHDMPVKKTVVAE